ncbi:MAG: hypothetical protein OXF06_02435 [Bacteroidetes bacterium]|nr:hypothetical protein [Bacteroidota bacterium]
MLNKLPLDTYSYNARFMPALIIILPIIINILALILFHDLYKLGMNEIIIHLFIVLPLLLLVSHFVRDKGQKFQKRFFKSLGGNPAALWLLHSDSNLDSGTKNRYHSFLNNNIPNWNLPSRDDEEKDRKSVIQTFESAIQWLIANTRNREKYELVFKENISYGFRRNLYATKCYAIGVSCLCFIGGIIHFFYVPPAISMELFLITFILSVFNISFIFGWCTMITQSWVKDATQAYAKALLATCDIIQ